MRKTRIQNGGKNEMHGRRKSTVRTGGPVVLGVLAAAMLSAGIPATPAVAADGMTAAKSAAAYGSYSAAATRGVASVRLSVSEDPSDALTVTRPDGKSADDGTALYPTRVATSFTLATTATGVEGFCWALDHPLGVTNTRCENGTWVPVGSDGHSASISLTPTQYPYSTLTVQAYHPDGSQAPSGRFGDGVRLSTTRTPFVYRPGADPGTPGARGDLKGDLNGDGFSDLLATDAHGDLRFYPGDGAGGLGTPTVVGTGDWKNALIAHGGDVTGLNGGAPDGYEDILAKLSDNQLYLYPGNGLGAPLSWSRRALPHPASHPVPDWRGLQQIVAPGDVDQNAAYGSRGGNDLLGIDCAAATSGTCANAELWLYPGRTVGDGQADQTNPFDIQNPVKLGRGWQGYSIVSVDDLNGDGVKDVLARSPKDAKLYLYPGRTDNGAYSLGSRTVFASGDWSAAHRPSIAGPGNFQGSVVDASYSDPDAGESIAYRQFQPLAGAESGDWWATTPANASYTVRYADDSGTARTTTSAGGCLLFYAGGKDTSRLPKLVSCGDWGSTHIF